MADARVSAVCCGLFLALGTGWASAANLPDAPQVGTILSGRVAGLTSRSSGTATSFLETISPPPSDPSPADPSPGEVPAAKAEAAPSADPSTVADSVADHRLGERLAVHATAGPSSQVDYCLSIAWSPTEPDESIRNAALRKLRNTDSRLIAESIMVEIDDAPPPTRIGMMQIMAEKFSTLGGNHPSLNQALADQIRFPVPEVARTAITICSQLRLPEAYLPMRELASRRESPLRTDAITGLSRLGDSRSVDFFKKLLDDPTTPRDEIYAGFAKLGRPAALFLKTKLDDKDPAERSRALTALLRMATVDDLTSLYAYVHKYPPEGDLKTQIYDTIATIETRASERPLGGKQ